MPVTEAAPDHGMVVTEAAPDHRTPVTEAAAAAASDPPAAQATPRRGARLMPWAHR
jgi:hypothetical protein